jgi:hypothetical protein
MKSDHATQQLAVAFVNLLVPGSFAAARARLAPNCEYHYSGQVLRGDAIIDAFEDSHKKAKAELESVEYLLASVHAVEGAMVVVGVSDRLRAGGKEHLYSDRLAVEVVHSDADWAIARIEHRPYEEERRKLREFLAPSKT